jgi:hypothetical protein
MKHIILILLMSGCLPVAAESYATVSLPNGAAGAVITCSHKLECLRSSEHVCHSPYLILTANDTPANDFTSSEKDTEYIIQCAPPITK